MTRYSFILPLVLAGGCYDGALARTPDAAPAVSRNAATQLGRLTSVGNDEFRQWFDYDALGRVVQMWWAFDGRSYVAATEHGYPTRAVADGELGTLERGRTLPHALGRAGEAIEYRHDRTGRVRGMTARRPDGSRQPLVLSLRTNARGQVTQTVLGTCRGDCDASHGRTIVRTQYDDASGRMLGALTQRDDEVLRAYGYGFDPEGNLVELTDHRDGDGRPCAPGTAGCTASPFSARYGFDALGRLARAVTGGVTLDYGYDPRGNLVAKGEPDGSSRAQQYGGAGHGPHALARSGGTRFDYDARGNLRATVGRDGGDVSLTANAENITIASRGPGGDARRHVLGDLVWKTVEGDLTSWYLPGVRIESAGGEDEVFYDYGSVAERDPDGALHFHVRDLLGSTALVLDARGEPQRRLAYWPWGEPREDLGSDEDYDPRRRFGDKRSDLSTGFVDFGARLYMPEFGRFAAADPTVADGPNRYAYVRNNPVRWSDPSGYAAQDPIDSPDTIRIETHCVDDEACLAGLIRDGVDVLQRRRGPTLGDVFNRRNALDVLGAYDNADKWWGVAAEAAGYGATALDRLSFRRNPYILTGVGRVPLREPYFGPLKISGAGGFTVRFAPTFSPRLAKAGRVLEGASKFGGKALPIVGAAVDIGLAYGVVSDPNASEHDKAVAMFSATYEIGLGFVPYVGFTAPWVAPRLAEGTVYVADERVKLARKMYPGNDEASQRARIDLITQMGWTP